MKSKTTECLALALTLLSSAACVRAQITYDLSWTLRPGDSAPVPQQIATAGAPALNDNGQIAFFADGALFSSSQGSTEVVAGYGDSLPGGLTFLHGEFLAQNAQGQIAFTAIYSEIQAGIFLSSDGGISKIVADGDPAPGGGVLFLGGGERPTINASGQVAFKAFSSTRANGLYLFSGGMITQLAQLGDPAPGGGTFVSFDFPSINSAGQVVFEARTRSGSGIFLASAGTITKIVASGEPTPDGDAFLSFAAPSLNDAGQIAFVGSGSSGLSACYLYTAAQITDVARQGDTAPGGSEFTSFASPSINADGQVAFQAGLSGGNAGIFLYFVGSLSSIVTPGTPSPEGDVFSLASDPSINTVGQVAFASRLSDSPPSIYMLSEGEIVRIAGSGDVVARDPKFFFGFGDGINSSGAVISAGYSFPGGNTLYDNNLNALAHTGDAAPGGGVFVNPGINGQASINDSGDVVFRADLSTVGNGLFVSSGGTLNRVVASGDPAPGGGAFLSFFDFPSINNLGQVAFTANLIEPARSGIFLSSSTSIMPLVQAGDGAPGGGTFSSLRFSWLNDSGQVAFVGNVTAAGRSGVFLWSGGVILPAAQVGDTAPGGGTFTSFYGPSINASGQVAFLAFTSGGSGVYLFTDGVLTKIAREGDQAPGGGTLVSFDSASLNDAGLVAFSAQNLIDDYGVYLYSGGTLIKVARPRDPAPGGGSLTIAYAPSLNALGQVAMTVGASGGGGVILATPSQAPAFPVRNEVSQVPHL